MIDNRLGKVILGISTTVFCLVSSYLGASSLSPYCTDRCGFFVGGDILCWNVCQSNLEFAIDNDDVEYYDTGDVPLIGGPGKIHYFEWNWNLGVRLVGGYLSKWDHWDGRLVYTSYCNRSSIKLGDTDPDDRNILVAALLHPDSPNINPNDDGFELGDGRIKLDYQVLDFLYGRTLCLECDTLTVRPYSGIRCLWLDQDLSATYRYRFDPAQDTNDYDIDYNSCFEGVGFHCGVEVTNTILCNLELVTGCAASLVKGSYKQHTTQIETRADESVIEQVNIKEKQDLLLPGYELVIGLQRVSDPCSTGAALILQARYEFTQWLHTPYYRTYQKKDTGISSLSARNSIGFHGLTFRAEYHY